MLLKLHWSLMTQQTLEFLKLVLLYFLLLLDVPVKYLDLMLVVILRW
jgi:hypothetical protein